LRTYHAASRAGIARSINSNQRNGMAKSSETAIGVANDGGENPASST
jgi:hypothetical protein